jgi:group I intron endonuclease
MFIYKTTNLVNGKIYIGQTIGDRPNYIGSGKLLKAAINKYGKENFKREILEYCDNVDHMNEREVIWIARYDSTNQKIGYNLEHGGNGKGKVNEETKKKMRGRKVSEETIKKMSEAQKGRKVSEEHRKKLSEATKGRKLSEQHRKKLSEVWKGRKHSEETIKKMSEAKQNISEETRKRMSEAAKNRSEEHRKKLSEATKGRKLSEEHIKKMSEAFKIKVIQLTLDNLKVKIWGGARDADKFGFHHSAISACCKGKVKTHKGFKWMYLHEYEKGLNND